MDKKDKHFILEGIAKGAIALIPGVGGVIGSILSDALADRKEQRLNSFLEDLKNEMDQNKNNINKDFISRVDFLDVFEKTTTKIVNERSEQKRTAYKNILVHGILSENDKYDDIENQIRILDQLNEDHILLLKLFNAPKTFNNDIFLIRTNGYSSFFQELLPDWKEDFLLDNLSDLEINRLIQNNISSNFNTMMSIVSYENFEGKLTSRGKTFVAFILR